jgi:5-methylthioadenosine/S-adenosylhomocysteine deaminase
MIIRDISAYDYRGQVLEKGYVIINNGIIESIGEGDINTKSNETVISGGILFPGFANMHSHLGMYILKGLSENTSLDQWLNDIFPVEDKLYPEIVYLSSMMSLFEAVSTGTTLIADMYFFEEETIKAVNEIGIRALISRGLADINGNGKEKVRKNLDLLKYKNDKIFISLGPHATYTCSKDYLKYIASAAKENGLPIQIHLAENQLQQDNIIRQYGKREVEYLNELGIFDTDVFAAHCVVLQDKEIEILKEKGVYTINCPKSNLKLGSGIANLKKWHPDYSLIGTDSVASNNKIDIIEEGRFSSLLQKGIHNDPTLMNPYQILKMITYNAYKSLGLNGGKIEKGYVADLVIYKENPAINFDPVNYLIFDNYEKPILVIADGKIVYDGKHQKEKEIKEEYKKTFTKFYKEIKRK